MSLLKFCAASTIVHRHFGDFFNHCSEHRFDCSAVLLHSWRLEEQLYVVFFRFVFQVVLFYFAAVVQVALVSYDDFDSTRLAKFIHFVAVVRNALESWGHVDSVGDNNCVGTLIKVLGYSLLCCLTCSVPNIKLDLKRLPVLTTSRHINYFVLIFNSNGRRLSSLIKLTSQILVNDGRLSDTRITYQNNFPFGDDIGCLYVLSWRFVLRLTATHLYNYKLK